MSERSDKNWIRRETLLLGTGIRSEDLPEHVVSTAHIRWLGREHLREQAAAAHDEVVAGAVIGMAAKVVKAFKKDSGEAGEKLQVKAGMIDGTILDGKAVENQLANMPGKDELRAQLLATMQAPLQQFVMLLNAPAQNFVYVLSAKERKEG